MFQKHILIIIIIIIIIIVIIIIIKTTFDRTVHRPFSFSLSL